MPKKTIHPGHLLRERCLEPRGTNVTEAAQLLGVTRQVLNNVLSGKSDISREMVGRIARVFGLPPETVQQWQKDYELSETRSSRARLNHLRGASCYPSSKDLSSWADTINARYALPQLVRMLVRATGDPTASVDFPAQEDVQRRGWDGIVESRSRSRYVPAGCSAWELSTESNPEAKADRDYQKRSIDPLGLVPRKTTYITITARKWSGKRQWAEERSKERTWRRVVAYDATDLEQWLELAPDVAVGFATKIGLRPQGVQSLGEFWDGFRHSTDYPMTPELLLAGRAAVAEKVSEWLTNGTGVLHVLADSSEEALAFVAATIAEQADHRAQDRMAGIISVSDSEQARQLISVDRQLTLVWRIDDPTLSGSVTNAGHRLVIPLARSAARAETAEIDLPKLAPILFT